MANEWPRADRIAPLSQDPNGVVEKELDRNVVADLPKDCEVLSITKSGESAWAHTVRIETKQRDGSLKSYFKKSQSGTAAKRMMHGAFESENALFAYAPEHIPRPLAWGCYASDPDTYYYLAEFHTVEDSFPDPRVFVSIITGIHEASMGQAPKGRFGFHVATYLANIPIENTWEDSWETWFTTAMRHTFEAEARSHANNQEFETLKAQFLDKVIPRLLRPLESGGRKVIPCLIHSNLWFGNYKADTDTGRIMLFDSCAYWGHCESDLGSWRAPRYNMGEPYFEEYRRKMGNPVFDDDWDDRNALYALRYDLLVSALFPKSEEHRDLAMNEMKRLVERYPEGFAGFQEPKAIEVLETWQS